MSEITRTPLWKLVKGYGGRYSVSRRGRVWSNLSNKLLAPISVRKGYLAVALTTPQGKRKLEQIARLVGGAFIPNPKNKPQINHKDGSRTNNLVSNLLWGTRQDNANDRAKHGRTAKGEISGMSVLSNAQTLEIKRRLSNGELQKKLAAEFRVHKTTISHIAMERNWKWLQVQQ